jgi:hypothetical protein
MRKAISFMRMPFRANALLLAVTIVAIAAAGSIVYASIPDSNGVIHGCYKTNKGDLRVVESEAQCAATETPISWNQSGPPGAPGTAGPTFLESGSARDLDSFTTLISHTVTPAEAGLAILSSPFELIDLHAGSGGKTTVTCFISVNGTGRGVGVTVSDNGIGPQGDTASATNLARTTLAAGDVVSVECNPDFFDEGETMNVIAQLLFEHVAS